MPTPTWLADAQQNTLPSGTPSGSVVTKTGGVDDTPDATARTVEQLNGAGYFEFAWDFAKKGYLGLTSQGTPAGLLVAANYPIAVNLLGGGTADVRASAGYIADLANGATGVHTVRLEVFDSGGGVYKAKVLYDGALKATSGALTLPLNFGMQLITLNAAATAIVSSGTGAANTAPVANAGADQTVAPGVVVNLSGSATDDGQPSGTLTYTWSRVSGPAAVTFGNANAAITTLAPITVEGVYVLRLTASDGALTGADDVVITVASTPALPVAPTTYDLDTGDTVHVLPTLPAMGAAGSTVTDPTFGTPIRRITDASTASDGRNWGTPSGPATNMVASDDSAFYTIDDQGSTVRVYRFNPLTGVPTFWQEFSAGTEPTFSRAITRPHILYGTEFSNSQLVKQYNLLSQTWSTLYDLRTDVPSLVAGSGTQFQGACYTSQDTPERLTVIYGATQDAHMYITILDVDNPANRVTIKTDTAQMKVNGGAWQNILNHDGTTATFSGGFGLHTSNIDRTGKWVWLGIASANGGAAHTVFFNMETLRAHEVNSAQWLGHASMGRRVFLSHTSFNDPPPQWLYTELDQGGSFPLYRSLINPAFSPAEWYLTDHNNWNNCRTDGVLVPILTEMQRVSDGIGAPAVGSNPTGWNALHEEIALIATATGKTRGVDMFYRACHHRMAQKDANGHYIYTFRDSPRAQVTHGGMWGFFASNWGVTLGTYGTAVKEAGQGWNGDLGYPINHRRDLFVVRLSRSALIPDTVPPTQVVPPSDIITATLIRTNSEIRVTVTEELTPYTTQFGRIDKGVTTVDLTIYRGARKNFVATLAPGENITGWTIAATIRARDSKGKATGPVLATLTGTLTTPLSGVFTIPFADTDTLGLAVGSYVWDIWRTNAGSKEILMPPSTLTILPSAANP